MKYSLKKYFHNFCPKINSFICYYLKEKVETYLVVVKDQSPFHDLFPRLFEVPLVPFGGRNRGWLNALHDLRRLRVFGPLVPLRPLFHEHLLLLRRPRRVVIIGRGCRALAHGQPRVLRIVLVHVVRVIVAFLHFATVSVAAPLDLKYEFKKP